MEQGGVLLRVQPAHQLLAGAVQAEIHVPVLLNLVLQILTQNMEMMICVVDFKIICKCSCTSCVLSCLCLPEDSSFWCREQYLVSYLIFIVI